MAQRQLEAFAPTDEAAGQAAAEATMALRRATRSAMHGAEALDTSRDFTEEMARWANDGSISYDNAYNEMLHAEEHEWRASNEYATRNYDTAQSNWDQAASFNHANMAFWDQRHAGEDYWLSNENADLAAHPAYGWASAW